MITPITYKELKDILMDPKSMGIKDSYFTIDSPDSQEQLTVVSAGKNGMEFNKTIGFFHKFPGVLIYRCVYGQGIILVQKNDEFGEAKEVRVVAIRPGAEVEVPSGYGHTIVNTGKTFLAVVDNAPPGIKYKDENWIRLKHGLAYYIIDKKGDIGFEKNLNYPFHPQITTY